MNVENGYASKGLAGTALGLGIGALGAQALSGNMSGLLGGIFGNNCSNNCNNHGDTATAAALLTAVAAMGNTGCHQPVCSENVPVNRYELGLQQQLAASQSENALLKSNVYTDGKLVEVYTNLEGQIKELAKEVRANRDEQCAVNMEQAVYNGTNTATINCLRGQVYELMGLTKRVVPNGSVCPGWGDVTISPAAAAPATGA
jgi:hypothetical protein